MLDELEKINMAQSHITIETSKLFEMIDKISVYEEVINEHGLKKEAQKLLERIHIESLESSTESAELETAFAALQ